MSTYPLALTADIPFTWTAGWRVDAFTTPEICMVFKTRGEAVNWIKAELIWIAIDNPDVLDSERDTALTVAGMIDSKDLYAGYKGDLSFYYQDTNYFVEYIT